jgi:OmpA-OmpF porin, OOP family
MLFYLRSLTMKKNLIGLAVTATLSLSAFAVHAEDMFRGAWYLVPSVDYMHADNDLNSKSSGYGASIKLGKELSESWDLQGGIGYNTSKVDPADVLTDRGIAGSTGRYKQITLGLDALYMFSRSNFRPFLLAGVGVARNDADYTIPTVTADGKKTSWLANVGLGAQYLFNENFGLQADLRHQWSRANLAGAGAPVTGSTSDTIGNTLLNLGGVFRFGAPAPVVAQAAPEPAPMPIAEPAPEPTPAPEPVAEAAPEPACQPKMDTITIGAEKLFGFDRANLRKEGILTLNDVAARLVANPEIKAVIVTGHTDRLGSASYNQKLSERRAKSVADYLVSKGVDSGIIQSAGKGESEPVEQCSGNKATKKLISCLQPNRRVTIQAEGTKEMGCK